MDIRTMLAQAGLNRDSRTGAISCPIYQTATFRHTPEGHSTGYDYSRTSNPTRDALQETMAGLEAGAGALATSTGMAALTLTFLRYRQGDSILVCDDLYGGTYRLFEQVLRPLGIAAYYADPCDLVAWEAKLQELKPRAVVLETPSNPLMKIADLRAHIALAKTRGIEVVVDNTFLSPYFQQPLTLGADIVIHSGTKFLSGHNDTLCGILVAAQKQVYEDLSFLANATGIVMTPFDAWLILRGIKTLGIRMEQQTATATALASRLCEHPGVSEVYYPSLAALPQREVQAKQARGNGSMLSFSLRKGWEPQRFLRSLSLIPFAESLGGVETLLTYPWQQTHAAIPEERRRSLGVHEQLMRLSVGLEALEDLWIDLDQALRQAGGGI